MLTTVNSVMVVARGQPRVKCQSVVINDNLAGVPIGSRIPPSCGWRIPLLYDLPLAIQEVNKDRIVVGKALGARLPYQPQRRIIARQDFAYQLMR